MERKPAKPRRERLGVPTKDAGDWEEAALDAIASGGLRALSIPALAAALGVTKGSFYWHFPGLESLLARALERWQAADRAAIETLERVADPAARLQAAFREAMSLERAQALFITLAAEEAEPLVADMLRKLSRRRIRFLADAYEALGLDAAAAKQRAVLAYTAYLGTIQMRRQATDGLRTHAEVEAHLAHAVATLIPKRKR
ncbi:MAG: helix-turn-helix transcriptional regulator [Acidobacteria bacterium]|nr:helix-turn-helix transcriptional regulator [Acidobacteriota bacterium]MBV9477645.1 helix-turn-helix transcriptional regulator [Acidobacteriota bacterium]